MTKTTHIGLPSRAMVICLALLFLTVGVSADTLVESFGYSGSYSTTFADLTEWSDQMFTVDAAEGFDTVEFYDVTGTARTICVRIETDAASSPSGTLVHADAEGCTAVAGAATWYNITLNKRIVDGGDITAGTLYHVVYNGSLVAGAYYIGYDTTDSQYARNWPANFTQTSGAAWTIISANDNMAGGLWDIAGGGGGTNDTQYANPWGDTYTDIAGEDQAGETNATHFDEEFHWQINPSSALGMYAVETYIKNTSAGGYYLHHNETAPANNTAYNTTSYTAPALTEEGICLYSIIRAVNGTITYSNATDCDYMSFYDDVSPIVTITTPAGGGAYERGGAPALAAFAYDPWLLNATREYYYLGNDTRILYQNQNTPAPHGTNTTLYYNETRMYDDIPVNLSAPISYSLNISAMDSHTGKKWKASSITSTAKKLKVNDIEFTWTWDKEADYEELTDRVKWGLDFPVVGGEIKSKFLVTSECPITIMTGSDYAGHFVTCNQWADFQDLADDGFNVIVTQESANTIEVEIEKESVSGSWYYGDPATGGLNFASTNITYTVANYTTSVPLVWLNDTTPNLLSTVLVSAQYSYANATNITGANCILTVEENNGTNTTYAMNASYQYNYDVNTSGNFVFFAECGATYHDNAWNQTTALIEGFTINTWREDSYAAIENWNVTISNSTGTTLIQGPTNNTWEWSNFTGGIPTGSVTIVISASGYVQRTYYGVYNIGSYIALDAYLLAVADGIYPVFIVRSAVDYAPIEDAQLTFRKSIAGAWVTVAQATTDATGTTQVFLSPTTNYMLTVVAAGFNAYTTESFTPVSTTYIITLDQNTTLIYSSVEDYLYLMIRPSYTNQVNSTTTIAVECNDPWSNVGWFRMEIYGDNGTLGWALNGSSASCGIITANATAAGVENHSYFDVVGTMNRNGINHTSTRRFYLHATVGLPPSLPYWMTVVAEGPDGIVNTDDDIIDMNNRRLIAIIITGVAIVGASLAVPSIGGVGGAGIVGLGVLGMFTMFGWFDPPLFALIGIAVVAAYGSKRWST